jgi:hypothetical protein
LRSLLLRTSFITIIIIIIIHYYYSLLLLLLLLLSRRICSQRRFSQTHCIELNYVNCLASVFCFTLLVLTLWLVSWLTCCHVARKWFCKDFVNVLLLLIYWVSPFNQWGSINIIILLLTCYKLPCFLLCVPLFVFNLI